jgi:hypothetical protein
VPAPGKKIFVTNGPLLMAGDAAARCELDKPPGAGAVVPLRATTTVPASALLDPSATYVRPDGVVVGTGADLVASHLGAGLWQQGDGTYLSSRALWTGSPSPMALGTAASTCHDWTDPLAGDTVAGATPSTDQSWWQNPVPQTCRNDFTWGICVEQ